LQKAKWVTQWTSSSTLETWPEYDIIDHTHKATCICNPKFLAVLNHENNTFAWQTVHNSFDEYLDESETEPYTGL
jgi:hypothetical protein